MNFLIYYCEIEIIFLYLIGFLEVELRFFSVLFCGYMNRFYVGESNINRVKIF